MNQDYFKRKHRRTRLGKGTRAKTKEERGIVYDKKKIDGKILGYTQDETDGCC